MNENDNGSRYREAIFVGTSRATEDKEPVLEDAVRDAYEKATEQGRTPPFRVLEIWVDGENPLTEYRVALHTGT
jgi:hypothetical protein